VEWKTFQFHFHDFANLSTTKGHFVASPKFTCNRHQWELCVFPGGANEAAEGQVSVYLRHLSEKSITTRYGIKMIDKFGNATRTVITRKKEEFGAKRVRGSADYISRSVILDESQNILDSNGTLTFAVAIEEEPTTAFVPKNPLLKIMKGLCNDEATADVCFEVSAAQETDDDNGGTKRIKRTTPFYAHRLILDHCAPMLAAICGSNDSGGKVSVPVNDVKADVFRHLLPYVYGESIPKEDLKKYARDIIDAADKYSIVNLKLEAEAVFLNSTKFTFDNAMDNLLYADAKNCALLKESVLDFFAENSTEAINKISFSDFPGSVVKDLMVAFDRSKKRILKDYGSDSEDDDEEDDGEDYSLMRVSELRRKLDAKGLDVDGPREAMIEALNNSDGLNHTSAEE